MSASAVTIKKAEYTDLIAALKQGWADFRAAPRFGLFFGAIFAVGGMALTWLSLVRDMSWVIYPLVIGFALIGPFIATGLYEVSRRLHEGEKLQWFDVLLVMFEQHRRELGWMAFVTLFVFWVWMYQARTLFVIFFGSRGFATIDGFVEAVFTTPNGWTFLLIGHALGAVIALVMYMLTVISIPLLLDRELDFVSAMLTSIRVVTSSPVVMLLWGLFIITILLLAMIPAFLGLLFTLPIFGHASWHLYRRLCR